MVSTQWERPEGNNYLFHMLFSFSFCTSFAACVQRAKLFISMTLDVIEVVATRKAKVIKTESWPEGWYFPKFSSFWTSCWCCCSCFFVQTFNLFQAKLCHNPYPNSDYAQTMTSKRIISLKSIAPSREIVIMWENKGFKFPSLNKQQEKSAT